METKLILETVFLVLAIMTTLYAILTTIKWSGNSISAWSWWLPALLFGIFWAIHNS